MRHNSQKSNVTPSKKQMFGSTEPYKPNLHYFRYRKERIADMRKKENTDKNGVDFGTFFPNSLFCLLQPIDKAPF